jgi:hypothetical protein
MKRRIVLILVVVALLVIGAAVPPFTTTFMRTVLDDSTAATARTTLDADPDKPAEGKVSIWMSDGTESGDDGDVMIAGTAGGTTKRGTLWDFSGASEWLDFLLLETADALLLEIGDKLILE